MWRLVSRHLVAQVNSFLCRPPRYRSFRPDASGLYVRLAVAECSGTVLVAHSRQVCVYDVATQFGSQLQIWPLASRSGEGIGPVTGVDLVVDEASGQSILMRKSAVTLFARDGTVLYTRINESLF